MRCWYKNPALPYSRTGCIHLQAEPHRSACFLFSLLPAAASHNANLAALPSFLVAWGVCRFFSRPCHDRCLSLLDVCAAGRTIDRQPRRAGALVAAATRYVCTARPAAGAEQHHRAKQRAAGARAAPRTGRNRPQHPARAGTGFQHIPNRAGTTQRRIGSHAGPAIARGTGRLGANAKAGVRHAQPAA